MITAPTTTAQGATFIKAPNDSAFSKVFLNNMDRNSFGVDMERSTIDKQLAQMISNGKTETTAGSSNKFCKESIWGRRAVGSSGDGGLLVMLLTWAKKAATLPPFSLFLSFRGGFSTMMILG